MLVLQKHPSDVALLVLDRLFDELVPVLLIKVFDIEVFPENGDAIFETLDLAGMVAFAELYLIFESLDLFL